MKARYPGKFEGCSDQTLGEELYSITLDGGHDEELGDVEGSGWYALILSSSSIPSRTEPKAYIVSEDSQGFFDYTEYESNTAALKVWAKLEKEYEAFSESER